MNAPCVDIKAILDAVSSGMGTTNIYASYMPDNTDTVLSIIDGPGAPPEASYEYQRPSIQVKVRAKVYTTAYSIINEVKETLHGYANQVVNGTRYIQILAEGDIMSLGYDKNKRVSLVLNFMIHRTTA